MANCVAGCWMAVDPKRHVEIWKLADRAHQGRLIPIMQMIKGWNNQHHGLLRAFHLETLVLRVLDNVEIADFPSGVRYVLGRMRTAVQGGIEDPAGLDHDLSAYLEPADRMEVVTDLETAFERAVEAERWEYQGKTWQAFVLWQLIFGDYFPIYI